jgi:DNA-directed RNA polymerase subunit RPC12/RpoP
MFDFVTCPHCNYVAHIGGLIGKHTNDCPKCGKRALYPAPQQTPTTLTQTNRKLNHHAPH